MMGATSCVRQLGQLILSMPVHMTDESESKGKLTIACNNDESPREITWLSPSSTCTINGTSMEMISVALQSLASREVIWYMPSLSPVKSGDDWNTVPSIEYVNGATPPLTLTVIFPSC